jgi:hypothetical protein
MLSLQSIKVFVDPNLKQIDSEIFSRIQSLSLSKEYQITNSLEFSMNEAFPQLIFYSDNNLCISKENNSYNKHFFVKVMSENLNFFTEIDEGKDEFSINTVCEVDMAFDLFSSLYWEYVSTVTRKNQKIALKNLLELKKSINLDLLEKEELLKINEFERELYSVATIAELSSKIKDLADTIFKTSLLIKMENEVQEQDLLKILELRPSEDEVLFLLFNQDSIKKELLFTLYLATLERIKLFGKVITNSIELNQWEEHLNSIDFPIVLFNENSQLVIHNSFFPALKLSSKACYTYEHNHEVKLMGENYRIIRTQFLKGELFFFIPSEESSNDDGNPSSEELGIVSSSIAHELNNPLAGIMAALDVLLLDDYNDEEIVEKFVDMKGGVSRCKKLVETFLGFSKLNSTHFDCTPEKIIHESVTQAIELLRFRLIENNINFDYSLVSQKPFVGVCNQHILTMTFYLILGELVTSNSHQNLIENSNNNSLNVKIVESDRAISFESVSRLDSTSSFWSSKLFGHLLHSEKLDLNLKNDIVELRLL